MLHLPLVVNVISLYLTCSKRITYNGIIWAFVRIIFPFYRRVILILLPCKQIYIADPRIGWAIQEIYVYTTEKRTITVWIFFLFFRPTTCRVCGRPQNIRGYNGNITRNVCLKPKRIIGSAHRGEVFITCITHKIRVRDSLFIIGQNGLRHVGGSPRSDVSETDISRFSRKRKKPTAI